MVPRPIAAIICILFLSSLILTTSQAGEEEEKVSWREFVQHFDNMETENKVGTVQIRLVGSATKVVEGENGEPIENVPLDPTEEMGLYYRTSHGSDTTLFGRAQACHSSTTNTFWLFKSVDDFGINFFDNADFFAVLRRKVEVMAVDRDAAVVTAEKEDYHEFINSHPLLYYEPIFLFKLNDSISGKMQSTQSPPASGGTDEDEKTIVAFEMEWDLSQPQQHHRHRQTSQKQQQKPAEGASPVLHFCGKSPHLEVLLQSLLRNPETKHHVEIRLGTSVEEVVKVGAAEASQGERWQGWKNLGPVHEGSSGEQWLARPLPPNRELGLYITAQGEENEGEIIAKSSFTANSYTFQFEVDRETALKYSKRDFYILLHHLTKSGGWYPHIDHTIDEKANQHHEAKALTKCLAAAKRQTKKDSTQRACPLVFPWRMSQWVMKKAKRPSTFLQADSVETWHGAVSPLSIIFKVYPNCKIFFDLATGLGTTQLDTKCL